MQTELSIEQNETYPTRSRVVSVSSNREYKNNQNDNNVNVEINQVVRESKEKEIDEIEYRLWGKQEVLNWVEAQLKGNNIDAEIIKSFINEFAKQNITGKILYQLKNDSNLEKSIQILKSQFANHNQTFGIWYAIQPAIESLGENDYCD